MNAITINEQTVQTAVQEMQAKGYNLLPLYEREGKLLPRKKIREHWDNPTLPDDDQETNLGVLTRNVIVLDLDRKNGKDGVRTLQDAGLTYPDSFIVHTPSNGLHVYYKIPDGLSCTDLKKDLGTHAGVDILCGKNAYAVAPGSSKNGRLYEAQSELPAVDELPEPPEWIMQLILRTAPASTSEGNSAKAQQDLKAFDYSMNTPDEVKEREIRSVLARVDVTKITENDWFRAGAAIKTELGDYGFKLWDEWSSTDERYKEDEMLTRYDGFQADGVLNFFELERLRKVPEYRVPGKYRTEDLHTPWREQQAVHGQVLSNEHDESFRDMHELVAEMLNGLNRWVSYSAAPGTGKTTAVFSILKTIAQRPPEDRVPLCIVFERVQACIDFMHEAIEQGVPAELINVNHSYRFDPDYDPERPRKGVCGTESLDMQKAQKVPFMIFSHEKIRRNPHSEYGVFQGKHGTQNRMMIWDEALLTTKAVELSGELLLEHCARFLARHGARTDALCAWVKDVQDWALDAHQTAQGGELVRPAMSVCSLPVTSPNEVSKVIAQFNSRYPVLRELYDYLMEGRDELRYVQGKSWSLCDYSVIIDEDLDRLLVLDASAAIEHLSKLNPRMQSIRGYDPDCSDIKVKCWNYASSKGTTKRSTGEFSAQVNWMFERLSENLDKKCLVINTLEYAGMYGDSFERAYRESAFRMEDFAKNQKVSFLHWGNHTALNDYRDYEVVIVPQMLYLPETHLLTQAVGESGTWDAFNDMHESMNKLKDSNVRARITQGMFRARGRNIQNGRRQGMLVCLRCDRALRLMQRLVKDGHLPGCNPEYMGGKEGNAQKVERLFSEAFSTCMAQGVHKISSVRLKDTIRESTPDLKTETGKLVTELGNQGQFWESLGKEGITSIHTEHEGEDYIWEQQGRSWVLRV